MKKLFLLFLSLCALVAPVATGAKPAAVTFKKSAIWLEANPEPVRAGDTVTLKMRYRLDPSETWGTKPTQLVCQPLGPWIDNPDGVINTKRQHVGYPGLGRQARAAEPGEHVATFTWKLGRTYRYNSCFFLCKFVGPDGKDWPWEWRGGDLRFIPEHSPFLLQPTALGGLFTYGEKPQIELAWDAKNTSGAHTVAVTVKSVEGKTVWQKDIRIDAAQHKQMISLDGFAARGTFAVTVEVPGLGGDTCFFGTIPKVAAEDAARSPFGVTNLADADFIRVARRLGFAHTRLFETWKELEPAPDVWCLEALDAKIKLNNELGLRPWICLYAPPAWALPAGMARVGYEPSPFDLDGWRAILDKLARRYPKQLLGFEMLNEIVPGNKCKDPVKEYVEICRAGYEAVKKVDPNLSVLLAGGLWPHNYRIDLLNAGIGKWIDVLPVHYSTYEGVAEARGDLAARALDRVAVTDDETASGLSTWNLPPAQMLAKSVDQCRHVMTRWPDELCAGAKMITYFGGMGDACGNWSYLIDRKTPRPCAVTLGVVQSVLCGARPIGKFFLGGATVHLFEKNGKGVAFVSAAGRKDVEVTLPTKTVVTVTDYQGRQTTAPGGRLTVGEMPVIVTGFDLAAFMLHAAVQVGGGTVPVAEPQIVVPADEDAWQIPVTVRNPFGAERTFTLAADVVWATVEPVAVKLAPGASRTCTLALRRKVGAKLARVVKFAVKVSVGGLSPVEKPLALCLVDPKAIGNLAVNGDFEDGLKPWGGKQACVPAPDGTGAALCLQGTGANQWKSVWQNVEIPVPGQTYLYTCWMRGEGQGGGSNLTESFSDGTKAKMYTMPSVFSMGDTGSPGWRLMVKRFATHANTKSLTLSPVAAGTGKTYVDNVQLSLDHGTDFVAFAARKGGAARSSAIPLCCDNQVQATAGYTWRPKNLSGVATFAWDEAGLALTCTVEDDVSAPKAITSSTSATGDEALAGDVLALAIFPQMRPDGTMGSEQLRWYLSLANPGGGSGATTLFRPKKYALGLPSGQLAKDSSVYRVNFRREGTRTIYELVIPWRELPGFTPAKGASFGCNLVLVDADGDKARGRMVWGADLGETSAGCGRVTLVP